jgi:hypothetical protein
MKDLGLKGLTCLVLIPGLIQDSEKTCIVQALEGFALKGFGSAVECLGEIVESREQDIIEGVVNGLLEKVDKGVEEGFRDSVNVLVALSLKSEIVLSKTVRVLLSKMGNPAFILYKMFSQTTVYLDSTFQNPSLGVPVFSAFLSLMDKQKVPSTDIESALTACLGGLSLNVDFGISLLIGEVFTAAMRSFNKL